MELTSIYVYHSTGRIELETEGKVGKRRIFGNNAYSSLASPLEPKATCTNIYIYIAQGGTVFQSKVRLKGCSSWLEAHDLRCCVIEWAGRS